MQRSRRLTAVRPRSPQTTYDARWRSQLRRVSAGLLFLLGSTECRAGQSEAIGHLEQAVAATGEDLGGVTAACGLLALAYSASDRADRAVGAAERALVALADAGMAVAARPGAIERAPSIATARRALGFEAVSAMVGLLDERTTPTALRRAETLRARLSTVAAPPVYLLGMLAYYAARMNRAGEARALAERTLNCEPYPPPFQLCPLLITTLTQIEYYEALQRLCDDLLVAARRRAAARELGFVTALRAWASCDRGALADAEADARWALERAEGIVRMIAVTEILRVLIERDELQAADDISQLTDPSRSGSINATRFLLARGRLRAAQGRPHEALDDFLECGQRLMRLGVLSASAVAWRGEAALIYAARGDSTTPRSLAGEQLGLARVFGRPRTLGISLRACGLVDGGETGLELLGEAVTTLESSQSPLELARALADYGAGLRRAARRAQARTHLERALDLAHRCGAQRIANQARAELIAAGAKPRRDAITGRDALTAGEVRVARLAADGLTNREIAQALFITTKTAKAHLNRVCRKLEVTRRGQLADALAADADNSCEEPSASATAIS
jgi:DNA-binding CsgD family transcriptional regulator